MYTLITIIDSETAAVEAIFASLKNDISDSLFFSEEELKRVYSEKIIQFQNVSKQDVKNVIIEHGDDCKVVFGNEIDPAYIGFFKSQDDAVGFLSELESEEVLTFPIPEEDEKEFDSDYIVLLK